MNNTTPNPEFDEMPKTDGKAIASLVCGIASITVLFILAGIPAIILGHISRSEIRKSAGRLRGEGMALAGLIMGYLSFAIIPLLIIIAAIVVPSLLRSRQAAHETSAVFTLRKIHAAEEMYIVDTGGSFGKMNDLIGRNLVESNLFPSAHDGYNFDVTVDSSGKEFTATAEPESTATGRYGYFVSSDGEIRYSMDESLAPAGRAGQPAPAP